MFTKVTFIFYFFFISFFEFGYAQQSQITLKSLSKKRKKQEAQLRLYSRQIQEYKKVLSKKSSQEKVSLANVEYLNQQLTIQAKLIAKLQAIKKNTMIDIQKTEIHLKNHERELSAMKKNFKHFAVGIYKYGKPNLVASFFESESIGKSITRGKYVQVFQNIIKIRISEIVKKIKKVEEIKRILKERKAYNAKLLNEKNIQTVEYQKQKEKKQQLIDQLQKDKKRYKKLLEKKQKQIAYLKTKIEELVAQENKAIELEKLSKPKRKNEDNNAKQNRSTPRVSTKSLSKEDLAFLSQKGRLPLPLRKGITIKTFGTNTIEGSNIKTFNNGIDISTSSEAPIYSIYRGKVSTITFLPTFGNIIIVRHAQSFISVYANVEKIKVIKGQVIKANSLIGNVSKNEMGQYILHFELWKGRDPQNPTQWLSKNS